MELFFSPLSCSLASRIALYEAGLPADYTRVDGKTKTTDDGRNYLDINPRGQVPALKIEGGEVLTENVSVLQYLGELAPAAGLVPSSSIERVRMRKWLGFINSELHVSALGLMFSSRASDATKADAAERARHALAHLDKHLAGREWLTGSFTVADAYLAVVSNWTQALRVKLDAYPNVLAHQKRVFTRPAARRAMTEEAALYQTA
jgi:glutathione S-transferase